MFYRTLCDPKVSCDCALLPQDWAEKDDGAWRRRTEGGESDWRRPVPDRCVSLSPNSCFCS